MFIQKYSVAILMFVIIVNCFKINNKKRNISLGDLSYSYAATDIGTTNGTHIKTITVIRNIGINRKNINSTENNNEKIGNGNSLPDQITKELLNYQKFITNLTFFTDVTTAKAIYKQPTAPPTTAATTTTTKLDIKSPASTNDKNMENNKALNFDDIVIDSNSPINADTIKQIRNINIRFDDKFDDYSMHNIKHLNNPLKNKEFNVKHQQYNFYVAPKLRKNNNYNISSFN